MPSNGGGLVLGNNSELVDLNQVLATQPDNYVEYTQNYSPYSADSQSSYDNNMPQQSPDPQGLANMNIASPIGLQSPPSAEPTIGEPLLLTCSPTAL